MVCTSAPNTSGHLPWATGRPSLLAPCPVDAGLVVPSPCHEAQKGRPPGGLRTAPWLSRPGRVGPASPSRFGCFAAVPTTACRGARVPDRPELDAVVDRAQGHVLTARGGFAKDVPRGRAGAEA